MMIKQHCAVVFVLSNISCYHLCICRLWMMSL